MNSFYKILVNKKVRVIVLLLLAIIITISLLSYSQIDPSLNLVTSNTPTNLLSYLGSYLSDILFQLFGIVAYIIPISLFYYSYLIYINNYNKLWFLKLICWCIAFLTSTIIFNQYTIDSLPARGGGVVGILANYYISHYDLLSVIAYTIKPIPLVSLLIFFTIIFFSLSLGISLSIYFKLLVILYKFLLFFLKKIRFSIFLDKLKKILFFIKSFIFKNSDSILKDIKNKNAKEPIIIKQKSQINQNVKNINKKIDLNLPPISLLNDSDKTTVKPYSSQELYQQKQNLLLVLKDFGIKGQIVNVNQGPVVTLYELEPAAGTKSSRVIGLSDDIARSLSAISARISVISGRNALGIELPNKSRLFFRLRELIENSKFQDKTILLPLILGKDLAGNPFIADLAKMPHLLVAGTTGSGKSVAINAMIISLLYRYTADECKMIMIDPKMLELSVYKDIPHLMTPVVTEPSKAIIALKWAVKEMENRYRLMSYLGVRNIASFNNKIQTAINKGITLDRKIQIGFDENTGKAVHETVPIEMKKLPFIVVIVDEMADLMLVAGKDIECSIQRLAQMARAAGIHIIMATQRPSVDVITGVIKANFPSRISFKVTSKIDSRTILGEQGAEQLLGMGDMLYMGNNPQILRIHGPFVDDKEVEKVADFLRQTEEPNYISAIVESSPIENEYDNISRSNDNNDLLLYNQALNIVKTEWKSSISYIQRSLRIGYNRAANIVEQLEKNGVLSPPNSSGKREILLSKDNI